MLERWLFKEELRNKFFGVFGITLLITIVVGVLNIFFGNNSLFLVALISLALAYPTVNYLRTMDKAEIEKKMVERNLIKRHEHELIIFLSIFVGAVLGMLIMTWFTPVNFSAQELFVNQMTGHVDGASSQSIFARTLFTNIFIGIMTFIISFFIFSGLVLILIWNASLLTYYLTSSGAMSSAVTDGVGIFLHGLLEVSGYTLIAIAGSLVAYKIDRVLEHKHDVHSSFYTDIALLLGLSVVLLLFGALFQI